MLKYLSSNVLKVTSHGQHQRVLTFPLQCKKCYSLSKNKNKATSLLESTIMFALHCDARAKRDLTQFAIIGKANLLYGAV